MKEIKIERIYAPNDEDLQIKLNELKASRIISIEALYDDFYKIIYEI